MDDLGGPGKPLCNDFGDHVCNGALRGGHERPRVDFYDFQWILGHPLGTHLEIFSDVSVIWSVKKSIWIAVMKCDGFLIENVMVSDAPTFQI